MELLANGTNGTNGSKSKGCNLVSYNIIVINITNFACFYHTKVVVYLKLSVKNCEKTHTILMVLVVIVVFLIPLLPLLPLLPPIPLIPLILITTNTTITSTLCVYKIKQGRYQGKGRKA